MLAFYFPYEIGHRRFFETNLIKYGKRSKQELISYRINFDTCTEYSVYLYICVCYVLDYMSIIKYLGGTIQYMQCSKYVCTGFYFLTNLVSDGH
jgi:hypothetical protein